MRKSGWLLLAALILFLPVFASAQASGDPRVKKSLDTLGIKYTLNDKGNFLVTFTMDTNEERSHMVRIVSKTTGYNTIEVREIWATAAILEEYPDDEILYRLMEENSRETLGAWAMEASSDGVSLYYTVKVPVSIKNDELQEFMYFVAEMADKLEEELLGTDEY